MSVTEAVPEVELFGQRVLFPTRDQYRDVVGELQATGFEMCVDVTAVDYLTWPDDLDAGLPVEPQRFEVVTNLLSMSQSERVRLRVMVPENDPTCPSIVDLYPGAENMEREAFDLVGVRFDGHPDLTRILMPEDWEGHPLRKDYGEVRIPVQFKQPREARNQ